MPPAKKRRRQRVPAEPLAAAQTGSASQDSSTPAVAAPKPAQSRVAPAIAPRTIAEQRAFTIEDLAIDLGVKSNVLLTFLKRHGLDLGDPGSRQVRELMLEHAEQVSLDGSFKRVFRIVSECKMTDEAYEAQGQPVWWIRWGKGKIFKFLEEHKVPGNQTLDHEVDIAFWGLKTGEAIYYGVGHGPDGIRGHVLVPDVYAEPKRRKHTPDKPQTIEGVAQVGARSHNTDPPLADPDTITDQSVLTFDPVPQFRESELGRRHIWWSRCGRYLVARQVIKGYEEESGFLTFAVVLAPVREYRYTDVGYRTYLQEQDRLNNDTPMTKDQYRRAVERGCQGKGVYTLGRTWDVIQRGRKTLAEALHAIARWHAAKHTLDGAAVLNEEEVVQRAAKDNLHDLTKLLSPTPPEKGAVLTGVPMGAPKSRKKVGVVATILEILRAASADKPVSKNEVHAELCKRFPEREARGMRNTVNNFPSWIPSEQKLILNTNKKGGYWI